MEAEQPRYKLPSIPKIEPKSTLSPEKFCGNPRLFLAIATIRCNEFNKSDRNGRKFGLALGNFPEHEIDKPGVLLVGKAFVGRQRIRDS